METKDPTQDSASHASAPTPTVASVEKSAPSQSSKPPLSKKATGTEIPKLPPTIFNAFTSTKEDLIATGNAELDLAMFFENRIGVFYSRENGQPTITSVELNAVNFRYLVTDVMGVVLRRAMRLKGFESEAEINLRLNEVLPPIMNGICVMMYLRLRSLNQMLVDQKARYYSKPKTPHQFEVPVPFALAIQQLGVLEANSLPVRAIYVPTAPDADCNTKLLPANTRWNVTAYAQAVEFCKQIGIRFQGVDLSMKIGSAWWLLKPVTEGDYFELRCTLPEDNFTDATAVLRALFIAPQFTLHDSAIFNLSDMTTDYGSMLRQPHDGISANCFFAINNEVETVWDVAN